MSDYESADWQVAADGIHVGQEPDPASGATVPPIHPASTYTQESQDEHKGFEHTGSGNPTRLELAERQMCGGGGTVSIAFEEDAAEPAAWYDCRSASRTSKT